MGNVYVADTMNHRIQFISSGQLDGVTIAGMTASSGNSSTLLNSPYSLALDNQLNLYVSDSNNHRIQKFFHY
jgi:DNA-binding beta-propeller fold protein YncE